MRRLIALILVFISCFTFTVPAQADKANYFKLYIDISSETNLMFSTYAITVKLDGTEIGSVANGKVFTCLTDVLRGEHSLTFCKAWSTSPQCTKKITISGDMTYSCVLSHDSTAIEIKNEKIENNISGATLEVVDVTGLILSEAFSKLENIGFSNLREEPYSSIWDRNNWIVMAQSIAPGTIVDKNEFIQLDCIPLDEYFSSAHVDNIGSATFEVADVTGMVLSEAFSKLRGIGFYNLREEPYSSIWNKNNWIVTAQGIAPGTIVDKNEFIQLNCIRLDDYFSNTYVGKQVNEIQKLAAASGFALRFENELWTNMDSQVAVMDQETKENWVAIKARQYGGANKTAVVTIKYTGEVVTPEVLPTPARTTTIETYDVDKDLTVVQCKRAANKITMYHVSFAEIDSSGNLINLYTFNSMINPRIMGKQFNSLGDLPSWFYLGATVHVRANIIDGALSEMDCIVTEATGTTNVTQAPKMEEPTMPVMSGTNLDIVLEAASMFGMTRAFNDEDFGHGTKMCSLTSDNGGLTLDVIYSTRTNEILCGSIVTFNHLSSSKEQKAFINAMAGVLCPEDDKENITNWVKSNVGGSAETTLNGFFYEVSLGTVGSALYDAGVRNWEEWNLSFYE